MRCLCKHILALKSSWRKQRCGKAPWPVPFLLCIKPPLDLRPKPAESGLKHVTPCQCPFPRWALGLQQMFGFCLFGFGSPAFQASPCGLSRTLIWCIGRLEILAHHHIFFSSTFTTQGERDLLSDGFCMCSPEDSTLLLMVFRAISLIWLALLV